MRRLIIKFFILLLFSPYFSFSGNGDSLTLSKKNTTTQFFNENQFEFLDSTNTVNNSLLDFQNYLEKGYLGNIGLAYNSLHPDQANDLEGFKYSKNNFQNYFYSHQKLNFYNTRTPYTDLFYIIGSKKEQDFKMTFSYNVKKNWNITADFFRIRSDGFYPKQRTNDNFFALSSNYRSINNRYYLLASIIYNYTQNEENGGITSDSIFENPKTDKSLLGVNLSSAKRSIINRNVCIKQYFNFGRKENDTSASAKIIPDSRIILSSNYEDNLLKYIDDFPAQGFYSNIYNDSTRTFDSTYNAKIENELVWKKIDNKRHRGFKDMIGIALSMKDQFVIIKQREINTNFNNIITGAQLYNTYSNNKLWWLISGKYCLTGYNKDDYFANATIKKGIKDSTNLLTLSAFTKLQSPDYIYNHYSANNFRWNNDFMQTKENNFSLNYSMKKYLFQAEIKYSRYTNPLYFDNYAIAKQYIGSIPVFSVFLKKDFIFHNWHLNNKISYQYVPDSTVIRLPQYILEHSLYYENDLLKGAAKIQIGASVFYTSAYYANAYNPANAQFYLQDNRKYGNYPFLDFFINAQVKNVRVFFKIDHLNSGLTGDTYILTPNYPMNARAFKLGISWRFFD
ncbi:MAG: putative porin [Bacteroidia bacterium]